MDKPNIPTRSERAATPKDEDKPVKSEFSKSEPVSDTKEEKKKLDLSGRYRVREGYHVAAGQRADSEGHVGHHPRHAPGEIVQLSHEDALAIIRLTKDQKDPVTGRPNGPAIETEVAYNARMEAEHQHAEFIRQLNEANIDV